MKTDKTGSLARGPLKRQAGETRNIERNLNVEQRKLKTSEFVYSLPDDLGSSYADVVFA